MNRKAKLDLLLSKVEADKKEAFLAQLREAKTNEERFAVAKKFGAAPTEEEAQAMKTRAGGELGDEELDKASGGCCHYDCACTCVCF